MEGTARTNDAGRIVFDVKFNVPAGHYLYAGQISVKGAGGTALQPGAIPPPHRKYDSFSETEVDVYDASVTFSYPVTGAPDGGPSAEVSFQGCNDELCFLPETVLVPQRAGGASASPRPAAGAPEPAGSIEGFSVERSATGYIAAPEFAAFLDGGDGGAAGQAAGRAPWVVLLLIIGGGLLLNLTPCVLPMIPINIAILGAGAQGGSRVRGLLLGSVYGLGMAVSYGVLGVAVVLTGAKFGALNASPLFNLAIAVLFLVMALAMFGVFNVDLSRYQSRVGIARPRRGSMAAAFALGAVAALLAGACVAPVLIWVLVLAADLHANGQQAGLLLPFLLGAGMGLPWPLAGAGLSFLPRPGRWMNTVKYVFGAVILVTAIWYGIIGARLLGAGRGSSWTELRRELSAARSSGKPVLLDFWATWCKNCHKMEKTTFHDPAVAERLRGFTLIKFQAEKPQNPGTREVMDRFGVIGLPTYIVLAPAGASTEGEKAVR